MTAAKSSTSLDDSIAQAFVSARLKAEGLSTYPGAMPGSLEQAYAIQELAIDKWPAPVVGWKVGGIMSPWDKQLGITRLVGPVFRSDFHEYAGEEIALGVYADGFIAIEGEITAVLGEDAPAGKTSFTTEETLSLIGSLHIGVEIASSPFSGINDYGPLVTISDFGNNKGLVLGEAVPNWRNLDLGNWTVVTEVNGVEVGCNTPTGMPGGPIESVRYALENTSGRGRPLKAGQKILTGAVTGVHIARVGDTGTISMSGLAPISIRLTSLKPQSD